jgi:(p)ppGpp synthase/HD superfamily hydrolase
VEEYSLPVSIVLAASAFAAHKHRDQRRKGAEGSPYINHPIAVANVLANEAGIIDPIILAAALLHDTIEDTDTTPEELELKFGNDFAAIVIEVTDVGSHRCDQRSGAHDFHHSLEIVGQYVKAHLGTDSSESSRQEVGCSHPRL